jgi:hypothetical protein
MFVLFCFVFLWVGVTHLFISCVVLLCVFTFPVWCCDVCYDFRIKTMLGLWKGACLIYIIYVSLRIVLSNTNVLCFCFVFLRLVYLMLPILWIVPILIASLVFSNVYWSCVLYTLCCQFSGLSLFCLPLWYSLTFICLVSCIPYVVNSRDCPYFDCLFGIL